MALPSSGPLSLSQIRNENALVNTSYSLRSQSATAGKGTPDSISEFYGYQGPTSVSVTVNEPDGGFWAPRYDSFGNYTGGWYGDHYAWIYNQTTGYQDTLTFGGTNYYTFQSGQTLTITSVFQSISYDTYLDMYYQAYVSNGSSDLANANCCINAGCLSPNAEAVYTFVMQPNTNYYFQSFVRNIT